MSQLVDSRHIHTIKHDFMGIALLIGLIWLIFLLDQFLPFLPFERLGLIPRAARGLDGIITMPFIHKDLTHIISNSVPLVVTLLLLAGSRANSLMIVVSITLLAGILLWAFGREARHIGASGLVFGLVAFHICAGIFERRLQSIAIATFVGILYSTTLIRGIVPFQQGVSWEGHLLGAVAGGLVAFFVASDLRAQAAEPGTSRS